MPANNLPHHFNKHISLSIHPSQKNIVESKNNILYYSDDKNAFRVTRKVGQMKKCYYRSTTKDMLH